MRRALPVLLALALLLGGCLPARNAPGAASQFVYNPSAPAAPPVRPQLELRSDDRLLILVPHPDDEVLATGGLIQQAVSRNIPTRVVFLTNGDNNEFTFFFFSKAFTLDAKAAVYAGQTRAFEALRAGRSLGLDVSQETFLGYPDFGTLDIWQNRWGDDREAFRSMFSEQNSVPYWFARTPGAPYKGEAILADLTAVLADFRPTIIFTSHPGDLNPDHAALPLYLRTALWDTGETPKIFYFLTHYGRWPLPRGLLPAAPLEPPAQFDAPGRWVTLPLTPAQTQRKLDALRRHRTQFEANARFLESYMRSNELFDRLTPVRLSGDAAPVPISPGGENLSGGKMAEPSVGLPRTLALERATLDGGALVIGWADGQADAHLQLSGWRKDTPFGEMPKMAIEIRGSEVTVTERRGEPVGPAAVTLTRGPGRTEARVPLTLLGNPERLHFNALLLPPGAPPDPMPWVEVALP